MENHSNWNINQAKQHAQFDCVACPANMKEVPNSMQIYPYNMSVITLTLDNIHGGIIHIIWGGRVLAHRSADCIEMSWSKTISLINLMRHIYNRTAPISARDSIILLS